MTSSKGFCENSTQTLFLQIVTMERGPKIVEIFVTLFMEDPLSQILLKKLLKSVKCFTWSAFWKIVVFLILGSLSWAICKASMVVNSPGPV